MAAPARLGPYAIVDTLGEGGMGAVYRGRHVELSAERAVKVLLHEPDPKKVARFEREVGTLARVRHENVVGIHEVGVEAGRPWFAMDLVEGRELTQALAERFPFDRALRVLVGIARGVAALHTEGILHRDLKPQNVVLTGDDRPVVLDLGLAVAPDRDERLTQTGAALGTVGYMAPEQLDGTSMKQTDVYALGLIAYEVVTGISSVPEASSHQELVGKILHRPTLRPSAIDGSVPVAFDRVVARATAARPTDRYSDAGSFADALEALLEAPGPSRRAVRLRRGAAGALVGVALIGAGAWGLGRRTSERPGAVSEATGRRRVARLQPTAEELEAAGRHLDELLQNAPRKRLSTLERWLDEHPHHPRRGAAEEALAATRAVLPRATLPVPDVRTVALWGDWLLTGDATGQAAVWDPTQPATPLAAWRLPWPVLCARVARDGSWGAVGGEGGYAWFHRDGGEPVLANVHGNEYPIVTIECAPDARQVIVGGYFSYFQWREVADNRQLRSFGQINADVIGLRNLSEGTALAVLSAVSKRSTSPFDNMLRVYERSSARLLYSVGLAEQPSALATSPDQDTIALATRKGVVLLYALERNASLGELHPPNDARGPAHDGPVVGLAFSPDGQTLYSVGGGVSPRTRRVFAWDVASLQRRRTWDDLGGAPLGIALAPDGARFAVPLADGHVEVWATD